MEPDGNAMDLYEGLEPGEAARLHDISRPRSLLAQEYLFLLGENAESLYVVRKGKMELCFPLPIGRAIRDVTIESVSEGCALGWSSLVKPYRFTLSARAAEPTELTCMHRKDLVDLFEIFPRIGYVFMRRLAEVIGNRHLNLQALWARELQRAVAGGFGQGESRSLTGVPAEGGGS